MPNSENYELDPNFAVVCSFIEKFGSLFAEKFKDLSIESLKAFLEGTEVDTKDLFVKFHIALIRGVFGYCKPEEFQKGIIKFCKDFSDGDDKLVKSNGYGKVPATVKLRILKNLCEDQFQYNDRFNRQVNELLSEEGTIRHEPVGKDRLGRSYWFVLDTSSELRLFRGWHNELTCEETWNVVCREIGELQELIELLEENQNLSNDDKALHAQPNLLSPKKISPTELTVANEDAAKALYFSSICSSPRFIKSPRRRTKAEVRRDEKRHKLPHCKVKLSRLTKSDFEKWKINDKSIGNMKYENLVNPRSEKCIKGGKENFERTVNASPDITGNKNKVEEVIIKKETENIAECFDVSSLKSVAKEVKADSVDTNVCKLNEMKSASPNHCPVQKIDQKDSNIKCTLKTNTIERTNGTVREQPCPLKDEEHNISNDVLNVSKSAHSCTENSPNLSETCSERSGSDSHVKTEQSSLKKESVTDSDKIQGSGKAGDCENDNKVHEKEAIVVSKEKAKQSDKVSGDLDKCPEENARVIINGTGDASSSRCNITRCIASEVKNGKLAAEDKTVINSAENSQDPKEAIPTDNKTNDSEKDIFNAAIKDLLTLESKVLDSSVVTIHNETKCTSAKTPTKDEDDVDSSESDKKVLDKALKDLIQLEMMTQGSAMDKGCTVINNSLTDTAKESAKEVSTVSTTGAELECIVNINSKSAKTENGVSEKYVARVNIKSECSNSKGDTKDSLAENEEKKILEEIKNKSEISESSSIKPVNLKEKQNTVKVDLKAQIVTSSHKSWTNLGSAESYTQNVCISPEKRKSSELSTNIVIPNKSCDAKPNDANFLNKVMNIIHGKNSEENIVSPATDKTKCNSEKNEKLTANVDGEKSGTDNDMNILVGDEMIRIEVANNSSSDDADDGTDTIKGVKAPSCKEKSVSKTSTSRNIDLSMEKAAINSLYSDTLPTITKVSKSDTVLSPPLQTVPKQVVSSVPKVVVQHSFPPPGPNVIKLVSVNSGFAPIQQLILPAKSAIALPKSATYSSQSSHISSSIAAVIIRPTVSVESSKPGLVSILKSSNSSFIAPQSSPSFVIAPFNALPQVTNPVRWIPGTVSHTSQVRGSLNTVARPQLIRIPQSIVPRFVVPNRFVSAGNPSFIKMSLPGQTLVSSTNLNSFTVAGQQSVKGLVYVRSGVSPNVSLSSTNQSNSTVKLALKKHLEAPIPKVCVSSDKELKKPQQPLLPKCTVFIGIDGVHYNAATNQPVVLPPNKRYVIAGPGGKFYDKESGYQMDVPQWNNLKHNPGKVYLATNAKFSNEITKPQQKTKKKSKKKKVTEFREDTSDEEFEKMLEESEVEMSESNDEDYDYDYEKISRRVKTAKNLKLPSRRVSLESEEHDSEMEVDSDVDTVPVVLGKNAKRAAAMQLNCYEDKEEVVEDEESDDGVDSCKVCGSSRNPATILLCDECDEGYHMSCLSPPLSVVPLEDWFCSNCQHNMLVAALKKKLELAKKAYRQAKRTGRTISPTAFSINSLNILETERRSCRNRKEVSYSDEKFDRMVVDAVKEFNSVRKRKMSSSSSSCFNSEDESKAHSESVGRDKSIGNTKSDQKLKSDRKGSKQANDQKKKHAPVRTTRSDTIREDDIPVRTTRSDSKRDDTPVRTTRNDSKKEDDIPVRTTRSDLKRKDDIPVRTTRSDSKSDDTPVRTTRSETKKDTLVRSTRSDSKMDEDTLVRTTRSDSKMDEDTLVRTTRSDSKMDEDTLVRSTRSDTKREEGDRSTSVKHKKTKLTSTDVVSDDSGSEYVQTDNSSSSDLEDSTSVEAVSPEKKTYLTLSGRATKNVSYR